MAVNHLGAACPCRNAVPAGADNGLAEAWGLYLQMRDALDLVPEHDTRDAQTAAEAPFWSRCDEAEQAILETPATTLAGVAIKLRLALGHSMTSKAEDDANRRGDLDALEGMELEWNDRLIVSAIRSLERMAGGEG